MTSLVRVCCACGAQDKALKLVAEAQVPPVPGIPGIVLSACHGESTFEGQGRQAPLAHPFRSAAPGTPLRLALGSLGVLHFGVAGAIHALIQ